MWLLHRWGARGLALVLGLVYIGIAVWMLGPALIPILSTDPAARAVAGVSVSVLVWVTAWLIGLMVHASRDQDLFAVTPITMRQYLRHNVWLHWPLLLAVAIALPATVGYLWWNTERFYGLVSPLAFANMLLLYGAVLLAPLAEHFTAKARFSRWIFSLRHVIAWIPWWTTLVVLVCVVDYWLLNGFLYAKLLVGVEVALSIGDAAYIALTVISPFSAVAVQDDTASRAASVLFGGALAAVVLWELRAIAGAYLRSQQEWDMERLEEWTEARAEALKADEDEADACDAEFDAQMANRPKYETDVNQDAPCAYDATKSPEDTVVQHEAESIARGHGLKDPERTTLGKLILRYAWLSFLIVMALTWMVAQAFTPGAFKIGYAVLALTAAADFIGGKYGSNLRVGLSLPVRLPRLTYRAFLRTLPYRSLCDLLVAVLVTMALGAPWIAIPLLLVSLRVWALTCFLRTWLEILEHSHTKWPSTVWHLGIIVAGIGVTVILVGMNENNGLNLQHLSLWMGLFGFTAIAALSAGALIAWVHRRDDASLPILRTSYDAPDAFDAED